MLGLRPDSSLEEHSSVIQVLSHFSGFGGLRNCPPLIDGVLIRENGAVDWKEICLLHTKERKFQTTSRSPILNVKKVLQKLYKNLC